MLLENLRFHPEEEQNDPTFAAQLAKLGEAYVNDAFGTAHRAHASTVGVPQMLPGVAGLLMEKELRYLESAVKKPARPYVAILGGAKVSDKIGVLTRWLELVDRVLIGGGMAYTFLKAAGHSIGSSKLEPDKVRLAQQLIEQANRRGVKLLLPVDHVVTTSLNEGSEVKTISTVDIPDGWLGADIGPETAKTFVGALIDAKTVMWNGPLGVFEQPRFAGGSRRIGEMLASVKKATTIIGGGDTAACVQQLKLADRMSHISTGGGASLEFLEGKTLPGIEVLKDRVVSQSAGAAR
jgi:phosphoglycerate kinase